MKFTPKSKFKSNQCYIYFNNKLEQDLFLICISDCFKDHRNNVSNIKIIGSTQITNIINTNDSNNNSNNITPRICNIYII